MSKGRICILCTESPNAMGGIPTIVRDLVRLYSSGGYEVHICAGAPRQHIQGYGNVHSFYLIRKLFPEFIWPLNLIFVALLTLYLIYLQKKHNFSVILPQDNYIEGLAGVITGRLTCCPVVIMDHGVATNISDKRWQEAWIDRHTGFIGRLVQPFFKIGVMFQPLIFQSVCNLADRFFFTGYELDEFYKKYKVDKRRIIKYEHLINHDFYSPLYDQNEIDALKNRLGIPKETFVINCTSRISFEKGYRQIVAALNVLVNQVGQDITLAIAGDTGQVYTTRYTAEKERKVILDYLEANNLMSNVLFLGLLDPKGIRDLNRVSDVHLYAGTMSCSFSLCVLEAMSCAVACIVTPVPRKQLDVITPDIGWVVPPGESELMGKALIDAYNCKDELKYMGMRARQYVLEHNTYAVMRRTYEEAITF